MRFFIILFLLNGCNPSNKAGEQSGGPQPQSKPIEKTRLGGQAEPPAPQVPQTQTPPQQVPETQTPPQQVPQTQTPPQQVPQTQTPPTQEPQTPSPLTKGTAASIKVCGSNDLEFVTSALARDFKVDESKKAQPGEPLVLLSQVISRQSVPDFQAFLNKLKDEPVCEIPENVLLLVIHSTSAHLDKDPIIQELKKRGAKTVKVIESDFKSTVVDGAPVSFLLHEKGLLNNVKKTLEAWPQ